MIGAEYHRNYYHSNSARLNANRKITRKASYDRNRKIIDKAKDRPCMDCGLSFPSFVMDFHHRDPSDKDADIASIVQSWSAKRLINEIEKCDVICSNCHRIRTWTTGA